ncbi:DUF2236 domain-containing protein [Nocardia zapadnayensis]|uniref:oxygenase MpaB family protein n=1 Tax=Nocardia TaxID=1817 RepID=UPI002246F35E|nr:DUF2236 domain-containing protein [Nocardia zapadnayensis]MCX0272695.1 DUF2236 domain-containing protein [Nocardia zapadnayensis]
MTMTTGFAVRRRMNRLDPRTDAFEIARLSMVTLHGNERLTYALFTVAFLKQVAVPEMARTLYRRGRGDIVTDTTRRNDDTLVFFGQLLDHGPDSEVGRAWISRLNEIHSNFPIRNADAIYTLATLALDPHALTSALGRSPFSARELDAHWNFWRAVAVHQCLEDIPETRDRLEDWARAYESSQYKESKAGREIARSLIDAFGERVLPRYLRPFRTEIVSALCPEQLRAAHALPRPSPWLKRALGAIVTLYVLTLPIRLVPADRSLAALFGDTRYGRREPRQVGYRPSTHDEYAE